MSSVLLMRSASRLLLPLASTAPAHGTARLLASASKASGNDAGRGQQVGNGLGRGLLLGGFAASGVLVGSVASADAPPQAPAPPKDVYARPPNVTGIPSNLTLYQYEVCPFCCKAKAVLDFHQIPYSVVEVNPLTKAEVKWSGYRKVPVLQFGDELLVDSSAIASRIAAEVEAASSSDRAQPSGGLFGRRAAQKGTGVNLEEETKWRKWVDERFVKIITANIYRNWDESQQSFKYITEQTNWSWGTRELARISGAVIMWRVGANMPKKYNIEGDLREALYIACNEYVDAVGPDRPFLGGTQPNLADLAVYGVLTAVAKTPTYEDALAHSRIHAWYDRMAAAVGPTSRTSTSGSEWGLAHASNPITNKAA